MTTGAVAFTAAIALAISLPSAVVPLAIEQSPVPQKVTTISFSRLPGAGTVLVPVDINGKLTATFIPDTGSTTCVISRRLADELGLRPEKELGGIAQRDRLTISGDNSTEAATLKRLRIGSMEFTDVPIVVADSNRLPGAYAGQIDGVLGMPVLGNIAFKLDFETGKMTSWRPGNLSEEELRRAEVPPVLALPIEYRDYRLLARGTVHGTIDEVFRLDTGRQQTYVSEAVAKRAGLKKVRMESRSTTRGMMDFDIIQPETVTVGTTALTNPLVGVLTENAFGLVGGVLGLDAMAQSILFIDAPGKRFYAGRRAKPASK